MCQPAVTQPGEWGAAMGALLRASNQRSFRRPSARFPSPRKRPAPGQQGLGLVLRRDSHCDAKATRGCGTQRWAQTEASWPSGTSPVPMGLRAPGAQDGGVGGSITQALAPWGLRTRPALAVRSPGSRCLKSSFDSVCKNIGARAGLLHPPLPLQGSAATSNSTDTNGCELPGPGQGFSQLPGPLASSLAPPAFLSALRDCFR